MFPGCNQLTGLVLFFFISAIKQKIELVATVVTGLLSRVAQLLHGIIQKSSKL
jgi:hypothetical protein